MIKNDFGIEALGMFQETLHQFWSLHTIGIGRPVFHIGSGHQLSALRHAGNEHRVQVGTSGIHGGRIASGA